MTAPVNDLLDTNIVSYFLRRSSALLEARMAQALAAQTVAISVLTRAELRFGQAAMAADDRGLPALSRRSATSSACRAHPCAR